MAIIVGRPSNQRIECPDIPPPVDRNTLYTHRNYNNIYMPGVPRSGSVGGGRLSWEGGVGVGRCDLNVRDYNIITVEREAAKVYRITPSNNMCMYSVQIDDCT